MKTQEMNFESNYNLIEIKDECMMKIQLKREKSR